MRGLLGLSAALLVSSCKHFEGAAQERGCMLVLFLPQQSSNTASTTTASDAAKKIKLYCNMPSRHRGKVDIHFPHT